MLVQTSQRYPITRKTRTTADRFGRRASAESKLDWAFIWKWAFLSTAVLSILYLVGV